MKKHKGKILVLFLSVLLVSVMSCENPFLKKMLVEEEKGKTVPAAPEKPQLPNPQEPAVPENPANPEVPEPQEPENPAVPVPKHTVSFSVEGAGGTLKARADGIAETDVSPITVEQGKTVTFTAEPAAGYMIKEWKVDGIVVTGNTENSYIHTVTKAVDVKVSFEALPPGKVELTLSPDKLDIEVTVRTADNASVTVEGCTETTLASGTGTVLHAKGTTVILKGKIIKLVCVYNQLTALNVQGCTALQRLVCWNNQLTALDVQGCTALEKLWCNGNQLTALNVQGLSALQYLECRNNQLTALNVQGCTALQYLECYSNQLTALDVQGCTALSMLLCYNNQLTELNVQGLNALQGLDCRNNQLTALNVQGLTALRDLLCYGNQLTALNVQGLTALRWLECWGNQLNAQAFIKIFNDLPQRGAWDNALCVLYTEQIGYTEGNHTDFTAPPDLKDAFDNAKNNKKWKMYKNRGGADYVEL